MREDLRGQAFADESSLGEGQFPGGTGGDRHGREEIESLELRGLAFPAKRGDRA